jgi:hypothetical protein
MAGADYIPREDVQIIVCANQSPYELFGIFDPKLQRRMVTQEMASQLEQRVHYVRLDGDGEATRRKFMHVTTWTDDEFAAELTQIRRNYMKGVDDRNETEKFLKEAVKIYEARTPYGAGLEDFINICLGDGNDIALARLMYDYSLKHKKASTEMWQRIPFFAGPPPSGRMMFEGLKKHKADLGDNFDNRYIDAVLNFPGEFYKYVYEQVLINRPTPNLDDLLEPTRKRSYSVGSFEEGHREKKPRYI